jgi:hypothetical protein
MGAMLHRVALRPAGKAYPADLLGAPTIAYARNAGRGDGAGPGEIVWSWVLFEEDHRQGRDRPVLVIARDRSWLLALPLTSKHLDILPAVNGQDSTCCATSGGRTW